MNSGGRLKSCRIKTTDSRYHMRRLLHFEVYFLSLLSVQKVDMICKAVETSQRGEMTSSVTKLLRVRRPGGKWVTCQNRGKTV